MLTCSEALVLRTIKYNDTSFIAVLFTEAEGAVSFLVRIPKSRRSGLSMKIFQPLTVLEVEWDNRDSLSLQQLRRCRCGQPYSSIIQDPVKTAVALFLAEFLYYSLRHEKSGRPLFNYLHTSLLWFDVAQSSYSNFHLVFLMRLSRFLGLFPNAERYASGDIFDLQSSCFVNKVPVHSYYVKGKEAESIPLLLRMNYETMHLFRFSRTERNRLLDILNVYYQLHVPGFPNLKSLDVLREVFG